MNNFFAYGSYYLMLLIFVIWVAQTVLLLREANFSLIQLLKKHWIGVLTAFAITLFVFGSVKVGFKTLSDETNLLSIANSMLNDKTAYNGTMGKSYYGNLNVINNEIPKRPLMFPFLVQLLHTATGFRYQNAFILNFIVMFLFLSGVYIAARHFLDIGSSIAAMLLVVSYPVFTLFGTSGGFDVLNSVFFMMILVAVYCFISKPSSRLFCFIFASLLMFANIRYESPVFLIILPIWLLFTGRVKWKFLLLSFIFALLLMFAYMRYKSLFFLIALLVTVWMAFAGKVRWDYLKNASWLFFISPLVMLPYLWQRILRHNAYQNPEGVAVFSIGSFIENLKTFFTNIVDLDYSLPYAGLLSVLGILILIYLVLIRPVIIRKRLQSRQWRCLLVLTASVLLSTAVYFAHFFGVYTHPSSARLFITLSIIFALAPVLLKIAHPRLLPGPSLLIISIVCFLVYHPIAVEGRFLNALTGNRRTEHCLNYLAERNEKDILIIDLRPGQYVATGYGAVNFVYANQHQEKVLREIDRHLFSKVIVFQEIEYETGQPTQKTQLPPVYNLEVLKEIQITATVFLRISQINR